METNKSKITIEFEGTAIKFGTENCSYEQRAMACKLLDVRLQQKTMGNMAILYCQKEGVDIKKYLPCKGADGQCNFECSYFNGGICTHD